MVGWINILDFRRIFTHKPKSLSQKTNKACFNYEALNEIDFQSVKMSNTSLSRCDKPHSDCRSCSWLFKNCSHSLRNMKNDWTKNSKASYRDEHQSVKPLSCGRFHLPNLYVFRHPKCLKCSRMGHLQSVCKTAVLFSSNRTKLCNSDPINFCDIISDMLFFFTTSSMSLHVQWLFFTILLLTLLVLNL